MKTTKTNEHASTKTNTKTTNASPQSDTAKTVVTVENLDSLVQRITLTALKTIYAKSGDKYILSLRNGIIGDMQIIKTNDYKQTLSDGYDVVTECKIVLTAHIGQTLTDDIDGKTLLQLCYLCINKYIYSQKKQFTKTLYLDDIDADGNTIEYIPVDKRYHIDNATDYKTVKAVIEKLNLTAVQRNRLLKRMRGLSLGQIAKTENRAKNAVAKSFNQIREKAVFIGLSK